jgi:hypothetical protein
MTFRQDIRFVPSHFYPWGIAENQVESASSIKDMGELELPMEKPLLLGDFLDKG